MASGPGGPDGQQEGFDWLYGKRGRDADRDAGRDVPDEAPDPGRGSGPGPAGPAGAVPPPDRTRMMPVQPRSDSAAGQGPAGPTRERMSAADVPPSALAPTPGTAPTGRGTTYGGGFRLPGRRGGGTGGTGSTGRGGGLPRSPRFWFRVVVALLAIWLVYTVAVPFIAWNRVTEVDWQPDGERPDGQPGTTYLLVGSDSRADLTAKERKEYATGNPTSELTDTIMLLHTGSGPNVLLSLPRDTIVDQPGFGEGKINSAFARGGAPLLTQVVENETGIRVDEYVQIGLGGLAGVVDAVGGVQICPRERMVDPLAGLRVRKGCQEADGQVALAYSRSRKQSALGDLDRVRRQREVVNAIGDKVLSPWSVVNPVRWWRLNGSVPKFFAFGEGMNPVDAGRWALGMSRTTGDAGFTCTVPVTDPSATTWDDDRADPLFSAIIEDDTDAIRRRDCTPTGL